MSGIKNKKKEKVEQDDIVRDHSLMNQTKIHMDIYGFVSAVDNLVVTCEDNIKKWEERLKKARRMRKSLGDNWGSN